jgi:hypothetical protein
MDGPPAPDGAGDRLQFVDRRRPVMGRLIIEQQASSGVKSPNMQIAERGQQLIRSTLQ